MRIEVFSQESSESPRLVLTAASQLGGGSPRVLVRLQHDDGSGIQSAVSLVDLQAAMRALEMPMITLGSVGAIVDQ